MSSRLLTTGHLWLNKWFIVLVRKFVRYTEKPTVIEFGVNINVVGNYTQGLTEHKGWNSIILTWYTNIVSFSFDGLIFLG